MNYELVITVVDAICGKFCSENLFIGLVIKLCRMLEIQYLNFNKVNIIIFRYTRSQ